MTDSTDEPVEVLLRDHLDLLDQLIATGEASFAATLELTIPKIGLLAAASWMESRVMDAIREFIGEAAGGSPQVTEFIRINALERKYHTLFEWQKRTINTFLAKFGSDLKAYGVALAKDDADLAKQISAFMELGELRNQLIHGNYAVFTLEKTTAEVLGLYRDARGFVEKLPHILRMTYASEAQVSP